MKLIAIRPIEGCNSKYLKLLSTKETYFFCNNFEINNEDRIIEIASVPNGFFSTKKPDINVQAIVGKNGSGKSTLIELLFRAINNIAFEYQKIKIANIVKIQGLRVEIYYETDTFYKVIIFDNEISFFKYDGRSKKINISIKSKDVNLKDFFYSIVVNYSHYAYNVSDMDENEWIEGLFHKNDGYRTPIVLNPFRDHGNIDINSENHLVKSRLIANLLLPITDNHFKEITKNLHASHLALSINKNSKRYKTLYTRLSGKVEQKITIKELNLNEEDLLERLDRHYNFDYKNLDKKKYKIATDYIVYKLVSIALKYYNHEDNYFLKEEDRFNDSKIDVFFNELFDDTSHVTLKLRQTVSFLKFKHIELAKQTLPLEELSKTNSSLLSKKRRTTPPESIELVPPPIFNIEILLTPVKEKAKRIPFKVLSSGEKQMIYSVSSILYHILNLESVSSNTKKRTAYRHINVVLEEVEMYAHPEMQRNYIKYIIECIERLSLKRTSSINLCFVTHSPFILSDIPDSNILFLNEVGTPEIVTESLRTFGGNIHDLLAHSFFLKEGAIGAFALDKINKIIKLLTDETTRNYTEENKAELLRNIQLLGEPFLKNKLLDMYYIRFDKQKRIDELEAELKKNKNIMINFKINESAANNHFLVIKKTLQSRITNILKSGIVINDYRVSPWGSLRRYLQTLLNDDELKKLITAKPEELEAIAIRFPDFTDSANDSNFVLYNIFVTSCYNISKKFSKYDFIKSIDKDTCPYCNRNYIYYISKTKEIKPQIDHFFPKSRYPFLAMSFYNLIPSCQTCNGFGAKEEKDPLEEGLINPYLLNTSDFSFTYEPVSTGIISSLLDKKSLKIKFVKNIPGHLNVFKLTELYEQHADHVVELIVKSKIKYSETYRDYLKKYRENGLQFSENEIDRMILGNYTTEHEIHKRPLAKLYQDIGRELGLIK